MCTKVVYFEKYWGKTTVFLNSTQEFAFGYFFSRLFFWNNFRCANRFRMSLRQCQETAADFHLAYGLWRFMAFRYTAYGKISESRQKPFFQIIRRNVAFRRKMYLFRSFLVNLSSFRAILNMKSTFFIRFDKDLASRSSHWHRYIQFSDCFTCRNKSSSVLKNPNLEKICSF
mgnify:CR=1 FL=1